MATIIPISRADSEPARHYFVGLFNGSRCLQCDRVEQGHGFELDTIVPAAIAPQVLCRDCGRAALTIERGVAKCGGCFVAASAMRHCFSCNDFVREPGSVRPFMEYLGLLGLAIAAVTFGAFTLAFFAPRN